MVNAVIPPRYRFYPGQICPRCKKKFTATFVPGQYCKECTTIIAQANKIEGELNREEAWFDQDDTKIAGQIADLLAKEKFAAFKTVEETITHLIERRISEERRRLAILKRIKELQDRKSHA